VNGKYGFQFLFSHEGSYLNELSRGGYETRSSREGGSIIMELIAREPGKEKYPCLGSPNPPGVSPYRSKNPELKGILPRRGAMRKKLFASWGPHPLEIRKIGRKGVAASSNLSVRKARFLCKSRSSRKSAYGSPKLPH